MAKADLTQKLAHLPRRSGVYIMKDGRGRILYVGKAKRLDHRVRSYFGSGEFAHPKQAALVDRVEDLETIVTDSDVEALLLEMTLIKERRPPYNIRLRDDKRYPYLKITLGEPFPKAVVTRRTPADGSRYFGPYTDAGALRRTLKTVRTLFPIRSCMGQRPGRGFQYRECLDYHIHRCAAPCIEGISREEYRQVVDRLVLFLAGKGEDVLRELRADMRQAAEGLAYERAAVLRDRIHGVERLMRRQKMLDAQERDLDVFAFARDGDRAFGVVLQVRGGTVLGKERRLLRGSADWKDADLLAAFLTQFYHDRETIPREVLVPLAPADEETIAQWLESRWGRAVAVHVPRRGRFAGLVRLAEENARLDLEEARGTREQGGVDRAVYALQKAIDLAVPPVHIEGFDVSNLQASHPVASLVVFMNGKPHKSGYRRYRMRHPDAPDDFAMMSEVVGRRAARIVSGEFPVPDLILIDGGKGQVGAALTALEQEGLDGVPVVGLAKREEEIVIPGRAEPLRLARTHEGLKLLIRVRDEAHRFAVTFHRARRGRDAMASALEALPGVGPKRRQRLLAAFGDQASLERATVEQLAEVPGIGLKAARVIYERLHAAPELNGDAA
jgi:excinuclease ABC subunit C